MRVCSLCGHPTLILRLLHVPSVSFVKDSPRQTRRIWSCTSCGYERRDDVTSVEDAIRLQSHFNGQPATVDIRQTRWPSRAALVAAKINRLAPEGGRALDVGCNTGVNLRALGSRWTRIGIELSIPLAQAATTFVPAKVHGTSIEAIDEPSESFDLVTAHAVIEHLFDPVGFIEKVHSLLRPGGLAVIMTGDRESKVACELSEEWPLYVSPDHVSYFSARSLRYVLEKAGFEIVSEDWRFAYFANGVGSIFHRAILKLMEIADLMPAGKYDHYYVYARKVEHR